MQYIATKLVEETKDCFKWAVYLLWDSPLHPKVGGKGILWHSAPDLEGFIFNDVITLDNEVGCIRFMSRDDADKFMSAPKVHQMAPQRPTALTAIKMTDTVVGFSRDFRHGDIDDIYDWIEINMAGGVTLRGNYIIFPSRDDAMLCYLNFA